MVISAAEGTVKVCYTIFTNILVAFLVLLLVPYKKVMIENTSSGQSIYIRLVYRNSFIYSLSSNIEIVYYNKVQAAQQYNK